MKLLNYLLSESKKGWKWPNNVVKAVAMEGDRGVNFYFDYACPPSLSETLISPHPFTSAEVVTSQQYEAALAASKPEWDGEGLPPVGCVCEVRVCDGFEKCEIVFSQPKSGVAFVYLDEGNHGGKRPVDCISPIPAPSYFRPIRPEADKKREETINKIQSHAHVNFTPPISASQAIALYDAIVAGKIPHIRID